MTSQLLLLCALVLLVLSHQAAAASSIYGLLQTSHFAASLESFNVSSGFGTVVAKADNVSLFDTGSAFIASGTYYALLNSWEYIPQLVGFSLATGNVTSLQPLPFGSAAVTAGALLADMGNGTIQLFTLPIQNNAAPIATLSGFMYSAGTFVYSSGLAFFVAEDPNSTDSYLFTYASGRWSNFSLPLGAGTTIGQLSGLVASGSMLYGIGSGQSGLSSSSGLVFVSLNPATGASSIKTTPLTGYDVFIGAYALSPTTGAYYAAVSSSSLQAPYLLPIQLSASTPTVGSPILVQHHVPNALVAL